MTHTLAAARLSYVPQSAQVARTLLSELRSAHRDLIVQMQVLDTMASAEVPAKATLTTARWKLGQASLSRRVLAARICEYFMARCAEPDVAALSDLQTADREMLQLSAAHLGKWTGETIRRDWENYCAEGRELRRRTHIHIAREQALLYPLLEAAAKGPDKGQGWRE